MLNHHEFLDWLKLYGQAWETLDPDAIIKIFAEDALYYETPFSKPFVGKEGIHHYWSTNAQANQEDVSFGYDEVTVSNSTGLAHWWASFTIAATGNNVAIDGFLLAEFNNDKQCTCFREWWHANNTK